MKKILTLSTILLLKLSGYSQITYFAITPNILCYNSTGNTASAGIQAHTYNATNYSWVISVPNSSCTSSFSTAASATGAPTNSVINMNLNGCGVYTIYCNAYNTSTLLLTMTETLAVLCTPGPTLSVNNSVNDATVCPGSSVTLSASSNASSYFWPNFSSSNSVVVSPSVSTCYSLIVTNTLGCQANTFVCVNVQAGPSLSVSGTTSLCSGSSGTLFASGATSYTWGNGMNTNSITISPVTNTTYSLIGNSGTCANGTILTNVAVVSNPSLLISASKNLICPGDSINLFVSGATSYTWSIGSNSNLIFLNPLISTTYTAYGSHSGCTSSETIHITVIPFPTLSITSSKSSVCFGENTTLFVSGASSYTWTNGPTANSMIVSPSVNTTYSVTGTLNGCSSNQTIQVTVLANPTLVTLSDTLICLGESINLSVSGAATYTWTNYSYLQNPPASPTVTTVYTVTGTGVNGCKSSATTTVSVDACTGISSIPQNEFAFSFYPNPSSGELALQSSKSVQVYYFIYDLFGREILRGEFLNSKTIDLSSFAKGTYFIRFESDQLQVTKKLVIN